MVEIKGKFIIWVAELMSFYRDKLNKVDEMLVSETGKHWSDLHPEGWYDLKYYNAFLAAYAAGSPTGERAMLTLGRRIYPSIKKNDGFPEGLKTVLDYIDFEARGYTENLRGPEIKPRTFIQKEKGKVIVEMDGKIRNCLVSEGVYLSIFDLAGVKSGKVKQTKCVKRGDDVCRFEITWTE